jgi:ABC-type phosphate transport system substrate-binding protein
VPISYFEVEVKSMNHVFKSVMVLGLGLGCAVAALAADLVVVGNSAAVALSRDQLADIYLGKSQTLTPLDLPENSPLRAEFYKKIAGRDLAQVKSVWSRVVFTGKGQPPKELPDAAAIKKAISADPKLIGYVERSAVDGSVKVLLSVD